MFKCDCCGLCCMNLDKSDIYDDLNRGDGVCVFFNEDTKLCSIYNKRPDKCNVDKMYELIYSDKLSKKDYYKLNYEACKKLKEERKKECI